MKASEVIEGIKNLKEETAINRMGCSENWYNFFYAMRETFSLEEIERMSERECTLLERLGSNIQEGLY